MRILLISPYHGGSHMDWAEGYSKNSEHQVDLLTLPARFWKWRMHGGAITLARRYLDNEYQPDIILATDMLDLTTFLALTRRETAGIPVILYMHENQLTYPLPADSTTGPMRRQLGERDRHYAFINYASMMAASRVFFNSGFHMDSFFSSLPNFLKHFPENKELNSVPTLRRKSAVLPVGIDLQRLTKTNLEESQMAGEAPLILWNQRWEYDKNPEDFFRALSVLAAEGIPFRLALCGQQFGKQPQAFYEGIENLGEQIVHVGYLENDDYAQMLGMADITISTAFHEFFGVSILESIYTQTFPILPNRLSYPELIPESFHQVCLYGNQLDLVNKIGWAITNLNHARKIAFDLALHVAIFDWSNIAKQYDQLMVETVNSVP